MIPKNLAHIWIGPRPAPTAWMKTWQEKHSNWNYVLIDNKYMSERHFKNQHLIDEYMKRGKFAGVADLIRYEWLYENGGFLAPADSICLNNTDELFSAKCGYVVYENEIIRPGLVSPLYACEKHNAFADTLIDELNKLSKYDLLTPWISTGNKFMADMIEAKKPSLIFFPSHYFIPEHFEGVKYSGSGKVYARQLFGETTGVYEKPPALDRIKMKIGKRRASLMKRIGKIKDYISRFKSD